MVHAEAVQDDQLQPGNSEDPDQISKVFRIEG